MLGPSVTTHHIQAKRGVWYIEDFPKLGSFLMLALRQRRRYPTPGGEVPLIYSQRHSYFCFGKHSPNDRLCLGGFDDSLKMLRQGCIVSLLSSRRHIVGRCYTSTSSASSNRILLYFDLCSVDGSFMCCIG